MRFQKFVELGEVSTGTPQLPFGKWSAIMQGSDGKEQKVSAPDLMMALACTNMPHNKGKSGIVERRTVLATALTAIEKIALKDEPSNSLLQQQWKWMMDRTKTGDFSLLPKNLLPTPQSMQGYFTEPKLPEAA